MARVEYTLRSSSPLALGLGSGEVADSHIVHGQLVARPTVHSFFCPECGLLWFQASSPGAYHAVLSRRCAAHGNGTIWIDWNNDHNRSLPLRALRYEFERLVALTNSGTQSALSW